MICRSEKADQQLNQAERLWLFLDYDGTLADFAATPDTILPDAELVELLGALARHSRYRLGVVSGRRLAHIRKLLPVDDIWLAGTYGIEILSPDGALIHRQEYNSIRERLKDFKPEWEALLAGIDTIYLEDKGWSLAIHAKNADQQQATKVLSSAQQMAEQMVSSNPAFRILGGHKFLEVCPKLANKGHTIHYLLEKDSFDRSLPVYVGDDDKDEEAFLEISHLGGITILVASESRPTHAVCRLDNPSQVHRWLKHLLYIPEKKST